MNEVWSDESAAQFAEALVQARTRAGLSQQSLADWAELSRATVARLEGGKSGAKGKLVRPTPDTVIALVKGLTMGDPTTWTGRSYARRLYRQFMKLGGHGILLQDPDEVMDQALLDAKGVDLQYDEFLQLLESTQELIDSLRETVQRGQVTNRDLRLISGAVTFILEQIEKSDDD